MMAPLPSAAAPLSRTGTSAEVEVRTYFKFLFSSQNKTTILSLVSLLVYFATGLAFYVTVEEWDAGDAVYFGVVVLTTVGYGDFLPTSDGAKLFTCFYVLFALLIAACALSNLLDAAAAYAAEAVAKDEEKAGTSTSGIFDEGAKKRRQRNRFLRAAGGFLALLVVGTLVYGATVDWAAHGFEGSPWVNGLYLTVITLTTVGFGDLYPVEAGHKVSSSCSLP